MNKSDRVLKLWKRGIRDLKVIARKLGYDGAALTSGIEKVKEVLTESGINYEQKD